MYGPIVAALRYVLGWLVSGVVVKALVLTAFSFLVTMLGEWLWSLLPEFMDGSILSAGLLTLPAGVWWVLDLFRVPQGMPLVVTASVVAFLIRRLPVVG